MPFTSTILMVRPAAFGFNKETAANNSFQQQLNADNLQHKVLEEFDDAVAVIRSAGVEVIVIDDTPEPAKPDAVFPNNWFCTMADGSVNIFPMYAKNRRVERRMDFVDQLKKDFVVKETTSWTKDEEANVFLEGTGSMVMDHDNKIIYACISERTHPKLLQEFADNIDYSVVSFKATDRNGLPVYHTNVLMCIGNNFCVICDEIIDAADKERVFTSLQSTNKEIISISYQQMLQFAGNMLQVKNDKDDFILMMSSSAFNSLDEMQKQQLQKHTQLLPVNITTIETIGGGSARCMMAEIFLKKR